MTLVPSSQPHQPAPFPTIFDLRNAHRGLLQQQRGGASIDALTGEVKLFVERARRTGAFLDVEDHRDAAQGLIDYWTTTLYRTATHVEECNLVDFDPMLAPTLADELCPYVGLTAFDELTSDRFYGRERMLKSALQRLSTERFLAVLGPSGSGKSSIVLGGIIPMLKAGDVEGSANWNYFPTIVPGSDPVASITSVVTAEALGNGQPAVIVVDQFEELFTLCSSDATREAFTSALLQYLDAPSPRHTVIVSMRSDYESHLAKLPRLQELFEKGELRALPLSAAELREAVEKPAERIGLKLEAGLVDALVSDVLGEPAALPLLQFTLLRLWQERDHNRITLAAYRRLGGSRAALARAADGIYQQLLPEDQTIMRKIFMRMVRPAAGEENTRRRIRVRDLDKIGHAPLNVARVLDKLVESRLVRRTARTDGDDQVEVAHEALIRNWPLLVTWLEESREKLLRLRRFEALAEEWERFDRKFGFLDRRQVEDAEEWIASEEAIEIGVSESLTTLVRESRRVLDEQQQRERRVRRRRITAVIAALATIIVLLLVQIWEMQDDAAREKKADAQERAAMEAVLKDQRSQTEIIRLRVERQTAEAKVRGQYLAQLQDTVKKLEAERDENAKLLADLTKQKQEALQRREELQQKLDELSATRAKLVQETKESEDLQQALTQVREAVVQEIKPENPDFEPGRSLGTPQQLGLREAARPLRLGASFGGGGATGSICCLVQNKAGEQFLLSLAFVVGDLGGAVMQPGSVDGKGRVIGTVVRLGTGYNSGALVRLTKDIDVDLDGSELGPIRGPAKVRPGDKVRVIGRGSGLSEGTVIQVRDDDFVTNIDSQAGDAGAPVVNSRNQIVGILYASADGGRTAAVLPILPILDELDVRMVLARAQATAR